MTRRVAIIGLGARGKEWARTCHAAGWIVTGFDPDANAARALKLSDDWRREPTISAAVARADWVICCLPDRLELVQMVLQRVQAAAPEAAVVAVSTRHDIEGLQSCALRPGYVFCLNEAADGGLAIDFSARNFPEVRSEAPAVLRELSAMRVISPNPPADQLTGDAESA